MSENEKIMFTKYYNPSTQYTSVKNLYNAVKDTGITLNEVKAFVKRQEASQLFKTPKRIKHYFPIVAKYKFEVLQIDLADLSDISAANENYKYLLNCIDVFSRYVFVVPLKNKSSAIVADAMENIIKLTHPKIINCDNGTEFVNEDFERLIKKYNIDVRFVDVGDHKKLGIIDRFTRSIRSKINKYMVMYNTTKYINVLPQIVHAYNNTYHSGIKKIPSEVKNDDHDVIKLTNRKYNLAKAEEIKFNVGDEVRYIINRKQFEKGTLPKWTKTVHKIISKTEHTYKLDNNKSYKYYEIQLAQDVEHVTRQPKEPSREELRRTNTNKRRLRQEGVELSNVIQGKRTRIQTDRFSY